MKKLFFFVLFIFLFLGANIDNAQSLLIPARVIGMETNITTNIYYTGELEGFELESTSQNFELEYFNLGYILWENDWTYTQYVDLNILRVAAVGNETIMSETELGTLGLFVSNIATNEYKISAKLSDGKTLVSANSYFTVLDLPHSRYGDLVYDNELNINDAIEMFKLLGTIPNNDTLRVISDLSGTGDPIGTWNVWLLLNKIVDPTNARWPIFDQTHIKGVANPSPITATWRKMSDGKWGLFGERITNGDLIVDSFNDLTHLNGSGWFKKIDNKVYFVNQSKSFDDPILVSDRPINLSGTVNDGRKININLPIVTDVENNNLSSYYKLSQNYPNPFNPTTTIPFSIKKTEHVTIKVYNMLGQNVATLLDETKISGSHTVSFDASNLPSGMYIYKITVGNFVQIKKMILAK